MAQSRAHSTIRTYLSGVRHLHIVCGAKNPLEGRLRLDLVLKGVQRSKPKPSNPRLPVTPTILRIIREALLPLSDYNHAMLWAACCLAFFAFLRCAEFCSPSLKDYDPKKHLSLSDIKVDNHFNPSTLAVSIKMSKTDPFGKGTTVFLARTGNDLCPVVALLHYLAVRGTKDGPLFIFKNDCPLSRHSFTVRVRQALARQGVDSSSYKGHSFRIGAATTAAAYGLNDSLIKALSRWSSHAFEVYLKIPQEDLAKVCNIMAA